MIELWDNVENLGLMINMDLAAITSNYTKIDNAVKSSG
jgi:hypothetical protein